MLESLSRSLCCCLCLISPHAIWKMGIAQQTAAIRPKQLAPMWMDLFLLLTFRVLLTLFGTFFFLFAAGAAVSVPTLCCYLGVTPFSCLHWVDLYFNFLRPWRVGDFFPISNFLFIFPHLSSWLETLHCDSVSVPPHMDWPLRRTNQLKLKTLQQALFSQRHGVGI